MSVYWGINIAKKLLGLLFECLLGNQYCKPSTIVTKRVGSKHPRIILEFGFLLRCSLQLLRQSPTLLFRK